MIYLIIGERTKQVYVERTHEFTEKDTFFEFHTVVSEVSSFVGNPVFINK